MYENTGEKCAKLMWTFETGGEGETYFFAFTYPYPWSQVTDTVNRMQAQATEDTYFYREILSRSLDSRDIELLTISNKTNLSEERESRMMGLFPTYTPRCHR